MSTYVTIALIMTSLFLGACTSQPAAARPREGASPVPRPVLQGQWLKNHAIADMWSGPEGQAGVTSSGKTSSQFCVFHLREQRGDRLYVFNPYNENHFWIDGRAVGPVDTPAVRPRSAKPADRNCADAVFDGS